ncbi:hypothetical protein PNEG_01872 [Pneumocystis murina B123]|uniref:Mediator of RNA polymerase II transcription subunit 1 n=1 Tax=Pneumocystis murina (strain B123) TaxID=1069680 RepID=M7P725_PNEMU|nr:hypothetical protein PNEG_01872 [Pneumocystis murina B123]EMR09685.1 hypothetical protein PNEG_01872 [Pneumocystis murina B123]
MFLNFKNSSLNKILSDLNDYVKNNNFTSVESVDVAIHALEEGKIDDFISAEALETLGKKEGLECFQDKYENKVTISLGGKIIVIDIDLEKFSIYWKVIRVTTTWADCKGGQYFSPSTDAILLANFSESYRLNLFKSNFQRLLRFDRLSSPPIWDAFSAIRSLYVAFEQIYGYELEIYKDPEKILCEKFGKPEFDVANIVGLTLWYWKQRRYCSTEEKLWRVIIEVEEQDTTASSISPAVNIQWIDQKITLLNGDYNWMEPSSSFSSSCQFVMILDPPVIVCTEDIKQISRIIKSYDFISQNDLEKNNYQVYETILTSQSLPIQTERILYLPFSVTQHQLYTLEKSTLSPACHLNRIPFSHPKQIHSILKLLRKYILFQTLTESYINNNVSSNSLLHKTNYKSYIKNKTNFNISTFYETNIQISIFSSTIDDLKIILSITENGHIHLQDLHTNKSLPEDIKLEIEHVFQISEDIGITCEYIRQILNRNDFK